MNLLSLQWILQSKSTNGIKITGYRVFLFLILDTSSLTFSAHKYKRPNVNCPDSHLECRPRTSTSHSASCAHHNCPSYQRFRLLQLHGQSACSAHRTPGDLQRIKLQAADSICRWHVVASSLDLKGEEAGSHLISSFLLR